MLAASIIIDLKEHDLSLPDPTEVKVKENAIKKLENKQSELTPELTAYEFEYDELWKKVEELKEDNKLLRVDTEWLIRESYMKDKLLSEKVSMLNNLIQKVNTTTTSIESNYQPAIRSLSNENLHQETDNRYITHLIGDSIIKAVNPELLLPCQN